MVGGTVAASVVQVGSVGQLTVQRSGLATPTAPVVEKDWVARVRGSSVWDHVPESRDTTRHR
ncbi:hypothetical protein [Streptomyces sp. NPDC001530]|uniref:hypothetical protein n=1 Tax=Streptomyces sp. NPDC001530 TaxID=3364582 RepID=UPI0036996164